MCEKILLIDGHSILNRAFYGLPDLTNSEGLHTGAVYGFLNILCKTLAPPWAAPHKIYVQFAPCQIPLTRKTTNKFSQVRISPFRLPPIGK